MAAADIYNPAIGGSMASKNAKAIVKDLSRDDVKMSEIRAYAKDIKKDHALAKELWATGAHHPRLLAVLLFDKKELDETLLDQLTADISAHADAERSQLADWLLTNQLTKNKALLGHLESWAESPEPVRRRLYWYRQGRLRWMGGAPPENSAELLDVIERKLEGEHPDVQWAMNFCAGWIGVYESKYRARCVALGKDIGLYKDDKVSKNCTPSYLPEFIRIEVEKRA